LGISKAAFYNWRRRYGFREKPAFLKLEQLELNFPGIALPSHANSLYGKRSVAQKILARVVDQDRVEVGQELEVEPDLAVAAADAAEVVREFKANSEIVWNPGKIVLLLGRTKNGSRRETGEAHREVRDFARRQSVKAFFDLREGTCAQVPLEKGYVLPGRLVVGSGSIVSAYGSMAAMARAVDRDELARIWSGQKTRITVPETVRMVLSGRRSRGVNAIDVALHIVKHLADEDITGRVIEFAGSVISQMSIGERFSLTCLAAHTGASASVCTYDATTRRYLTGRAIKRYQPVVPDKDAEYRQLYQVNIDQLVPQLAPLSDLNNVHPVAERQDQPVQQIVLGACTSGRFEDLRVAAEILKGNQVHEGCSLYIVPGSRTVYLEALKKGLIRVFVEAGVVVVHPGCCWGMPGGPLALADGERCLTTSPLEAFGSAANARVESYLCSPATAAASALNGAITDPTRYGR
jgi:homoaconitase/3-isopropylmalate dehydratase large subunit